MQENHESSLPVREPAITVIVSSYNQERFLPILLASLAGQEFDVPYEVVICDDGSSDRSAETISQWADAHRDVDIRCIWQPDRGFRLGRARNNGIRCAQGRVLVFVDCDLWLAPYFLKDHWEAHQCGERLLVCGAVADVLVGVKTLSEDWSRVPFDIMRRAPTDQARRQAWLTTDCPWMACTGGNFSTRRHENFLFDEQFEGWGSEDRDVAFRLYSNGVKVHLLDRVGALHVHVRGEARPWNPFKGGTHDAIVATLCSKLRLAAKYPDNAMLPSIELVRRFRLDPITNRWTVCVDRNEMSGAEVLRSFEEWLVRNGAP